MLLVSLAGCANRVSGDRPSGTGFGVSIVTEPNKDVPCVEGLSLRPGDSCTHKGGRFWIEDGQACYSGRYLYFGQLFEKSDRHCASASPSHSVSLALGELCFDGDQSKDCGSDRFGFGAAWVASTSSWQVSQVRQVQHVKQDGRAIRVEGTCQAIPCTWRGRSCLHLRSSLGGGCIVSGYGYECRLIACNNNSRIDATLIRNGELCTHGASCHLDSRC